MISDKELIRRLALLERDHSPTSIDEIESMISTVAPRMSGGKTITLLTGIAVLLITAGIAYNAYVPVEAPMPTLQQTSVWRESQTAAGPLTDRMAESANTHDGQAAVPSPSLASAAIQPLTVLLDSLRGIDVAVIESLRMTLSDIDSLRYCGSTGEAKTKLCVWNDGTLRTYTLGDSTAIKPVMFTTTSGRGVMTFSSSEMDVDVNDLIPIRADANSGSMVLWIRPNEMHINSLPDDLKQRIMKTDVGIATSLIHVNSDNVLGDSALSSLVQTKVAESLQSMGLDTTLQRANMKSLSTLDIRLQPEVLRIAKLDTARTKRFLSPTSVRWVKVQQMDDPNLHRYTSKSGVLALENVHPNPISVGSSTVTYTLTDARQVSVDVIDIAGKHVMKLQAMTKRQPGRYEIGLNASAIQAGIYMVYLRTDEGEIATQRVVIQ
jgi:hypothetical protein